MATMLNDREIRALLKQEKVILGGDENSVRPNSYILRLGTEGEFLTTSKKFAIDSINSKSAKKGIILPAGHSVAITSLETIDFSEATVNSLFPDCALHGILSPTTDLSREGIVAPTTQIDAGFKGTLNWTISNTSSEERKYVHGERLFRLTIFKLEEGEKPDGLYSGSYQEQEGYVASRRAGAPVGMKDSAWEHAAAKGGPEDKLKELIKSGFPWNVLGHKLEEIDNEFRVLNEGHSGIQTSIKKLGDTIKSEIKQETSDSVRTIVREELQSRTDSMSDRWKIDLGATFVGVIGFCLAVLSQEKIWDFILDNRVVIGGGMVGLAIGYKMLGNKDKK